MMAAFHLGTPCYRAGFLNGTAYWKGSISSAVLSLLYVWMSAMKKVFIHVGHEHVKISSPYWHILPLVFRKYVSEVINKAKHSAGSRSVRVKGVRHNQWVFTLICILHITVSFMASSKTPKGFYAKWVLGGDRINNFINAWLVMNL